MFRFKWVELSCISRSTVQFVRHAQDSMRCIIATETLGKLCSFHFSMFFHSRAAGHGGMPLKYRHRMWPQLLRTSSAEFEKLLDVQLPNKALQRSWKVNVGQCWEMSELSKKNPSDLAFQNYERGGRHMQHWLGWLGCWVSFSPSGAPHCVKVKEQIDADVPRTRRLAFRHSVDFEIWRGALLQDSTWTCQEQPCCWSSHRASASAACFRSSPTGNWLCPGYVTWQNPEKVGKCVILLKCQDFWNPPCQEDAA